MTEKSNTIQEKKSGLKSFKELLNAYRSSTNVTEKKTLYREICHNGLSLLEEKKSAGWAYTPDGWLSPANIKAAGYILKDGHYFIPGEEYISDKKTETKELGEKYWYYSKQYLAWKKRKYIKEYGGKYDQIIEDFLNKDK